MSRRRQRRDRGNGDEPGAGGHDGTMNDAVGKVGENDDGGSRALRRTLRDMEREMEVASLPRDSRGRTRRVVPRSLALRRTNRRKALDREDEERRAITVGADEDDDDGDGGGDGGGAGGRRGRRRLRGSRAAIELGDEAADPLGRRGDDDGDGIADEDGSSGEGGSGEEEEDDEEDGSWKDEGVGDDSDVSSNDEEEYSEDMDDIGDEGDSSVDEEGEDEIGEHVARKGGKVQNRVEGERRSDAALTGDGRPASSSRTPKKGASRGGKSTYKKKAKEHRKRLRGEEGAGGNSTAKRRRKLYRLRNFKSHKLAERHGTALGAHASGRQRYAVSTLASVAESAPVAPQVYSSLGLVYENLLREELNSTADNKRRKTGSADAVGGKSGALDAAEGPVDEPSSGSTSEAAAAAAAAAAKRRFPARLRLARKAYGSYHAAAVLGKKDFTLWVRAGDAACEIADLYGVQAALVGTGAAASDDAPDNNSSPSVPGLSRRANEDDDYSDPAVRRGGYLRERRRWIEEAKGDYETADRLRPPGITVPAKVAAVHMRLGNYGEALTILTDLRDSSGRGVVRPRRSELERSYGAWMLYADLMLRIGYEIQVWNQGDESNDNYMFRRWLRRYSRTFDWRERRLQSLCLALEAAAGTKSCHRVARWVRDRAAARGRERELKRRRLMEGRGGGVDDVGGDGDGDGDGDGRTETNGGLMADGPPATPLDGIQWGVADDYETSRLKDVTSEEAVDAESDEESAADLSQDGSRRTKDRSESSSAAGSGEAARVGDVVGTEGSSSPKFPFSGNELNGCPGGLEQLNKGGPGDEFAPDQITEAEFEKERASMLQRHLVELAEFDAAAVDSNNSHNSSFASERERTKSSLLERHRAEVKNLVGEFELRKKKVENNSSGQDLVELPITASCSTVCDIASQLMKHCLGIKAFEGGRLVAEAVASYLGARVDRHRQRQKEWSEFCSRRAQRSEATILEVEAEAHDEVKDESDSSNEVVEDDILLSDDEGFDSGDKGALLQAMGHGVLPPDIQLLYALSLMCEGGKDFLAWKLVHVIKDLDLKESMPTRSTSNVEDELTDSPAWIIFRQATTGSIDRTAAFSLMADLLNSSGREEHWSGRLLPLFESHFKVLDETGLLFCLERSQYHNSIMSPVYQSRHKKIILALARLQLHEATSGSDTASDAMSPSNNSIDDRKNDARGHNKAVQRCLSAISLLIRFQSVLWSDLTNDGPSQLSAEVLRLLAQLFRVISRETARSNEFLGNHLLSVLMEKIQLVVSFVFNLPMASQRLQDAETSSWRSFPIPCDWQDDIQRRLSSRAFSLCVGNAVSVFSGWSDDDFSVELLRNQHGSNFFGVKVDGPQVAGILNDEAEARLALLWNKIGKVLPHLSSLDFDGGLTDIHEAPWYKSVVEKLQVVGRSERIAAQGEDHGIDLLISFSTFCLLAASREKGGMKDVLIGNSLSCLLPITQFCLNRTLWLSPIGEGATTEEDRQEWKDFLKERSMFDCLPNAAAIPSRRPAKPFRPAAVARKIVTQSQATRSSRISPFRKAVRVPASLLLNEWNRDLRCARSKSQLIESEARARLAMKQVDYSIRQLRTCTTVQACQKASLRVAAALLAVASEDECYNPFLCLQQAAMFAGQGPKKGSNDEHFKKKLPLSDKDCSPQQALLILGRADCLRAVAFTDEAMFLCSYVVRLCGLHRDLKVPELEWNGQWRVVGVQSYIVSFAIDASVSSAATNDSETAVYPTWESDVVEEIERCRNDALSLSRAFEKGGIDDQNEELDDQEVGERLSTNDSCADFDEVINNDAFSGDDNEDGEMCSDFEAKRELFGGRINGLQTRQTMDMPVNYSSMATGPIAEV